MEPRLITVEEFIAAKNNIKQKILASGEKYDFLLANLRGGFYLADALSRDLKIPYQVCHISFRDTENYHSDNVFFNIKAYKKYLFVDDLIDSGKTVQYLEKYKNIDLAVILKKDTEFEITKKVFYHEKLEGNQWIDFFWEKF